VVEFTDQQLPPLLRALALDKVRSLADEQIQRPEGALIRSERCAVMRRKHAQHMASATDKGSRLNSSHASPELNAQRWSADEDRTLLDVLDDDALAAFQGRAASPLAAGDGVPIVEPPLREAALRDDLQVAGRQIEQLHVAHVSAGNRNGHIHDLAEYLL